MRALLISSEVVESSDVFLSMPSAVAFSNSEDVDMMRSCWGSQCTLVVANVTRAKEVDGRRLYTLQIHHAESGASK